MAENIDEDKNIKEALEEVELYQKSKLNLETWKDFKEELDLDEDIKIVEEFIKEVQEEYSETLVDGKVYRIENISLEFKPTKELANSISNVLSELNKYQEAHKILVNLNSNLKSELETYKKMINRISNMTIILDEGVTLKGKFIINLVKQEIENGEI